MKRITASEVISPCGMNGNLAHILENEELFEN
jgi:hypothetical protein